MCLHSLHDGGSHLQAAAEYARQRHASDGAAAGDLSELATGEVLPDNKTIKCNVDDFCYTLWQQDLSNKDVKTVLKQGEHARESGGNSSRFSLSTSGCLEVEFLSLNCVEI